MPNQVQDKFFEVAPHAGAWIEIGKLKGFKIGKLVAPHAGAWIEIPLWTIPARIFASLPTRERGLKCWMRLQNYGVFMVAPHAGAWIEILEMAFVARVKEVAPHAGAWIEM